MKTTSMGIRELDTALGGGIPKGFTVLVLGGPGSGKEFFAKQFAAAGDEELTYVTTSERDEDIIAVMREFGWRTNFKIVNVGSQYYEHVLAKKLLVSKYRQEGITLADVRKESRSEIVRETNFLTFLAYEISKLRPPFRVVINSLDFFLENYEAIDVLSAMRTIKAHAQHQEGTVCATMLSGVYDSRIQSGLEDLADLVLELGRDRQEREFRNYLIIQKYRNYPNRTGFYFYRIDRGGLRTEA